MQDIHIICSREHLLSLVEAFSEQFKAQSEHVSILDYGSCQKSMNSYIVLEWLDEVDETFIKQVHAESNVLDYSVYSVPCSTDAWPFGMELYQECGREML